MCGEIFWVMGMPTPWFLAMFFNTNIGSKRLPGLLVPRKVKMLPPLGNPDRAWELSACGDDYKPEGLLKQELCRKMKPMRQVTAAQKRQELSPCLIVRSR